MRSLAQVIFENLSHILHRYEIAGDGEKTFTIRVKMSHRTNMQVGDVAHIDRAKTQTRQTRNGTVHETLHQQNRCRIVWSKDRAEYGDRINNGELEAAGFVIDEIPGSTFG